MSPNDLPLTMILMRGIPGSGKSTMTRKLACEYLEKGYRTVGIFSTDDQFLDSNGIYRFDPSKLRENHQKNQELVRRSMPYFDLVIVDNTNIRKADMLPYKNLAHNYGFQVLESVAGRGFIEFEGTQNQGFSEKFVDLCISRNVHKVPADTVRRMARQFEF